MVKDHSNSERGNPLPPCYVITSVDEGQLHPGHDVVLEDLITVGFGGPRL